MEYTRDDLNTIGACIDGMIKAGGVPAAKQLMPLFEKTEAMAQELDANANPPGKKFEDD